MEPITLAILGALGKLSERAINDAYSSLKSILCKKFGDTNDITVAIEALEKEPDSVARKAVLDEQSQKLNLGQDREIQQSISDLNQCSGTKTNINISITGGATAQGVIGAETVNISELTFSSAQKK